MVKITNGKEIIEVTKGAFKNIYSAQGYVKIDSAKVVEEEKSNSKVSNDIDVSGNKFDDETETEEEVFVRELEEKPLAYWNKSELKQYCSIKGIDISGTKSAKEAKEIVKNYISA